MIFEVILLGTECLANGLLALLSNDLDFFAVEFSGKCHVSRVADLKTKVRWRGVEHFLLKLFASQYLLRSYFTHSDSIQNVLIKSSCTLFIWNICGTALNDSNTRLSRYNSRSNHVSVFILYLVPRCFQFLIKIE